MVGGTRRPRRRDGASALRGAARLLGTAAAFAVPLLCAAGLARAEVLVSNLGQSANSYYVLGYATDAAQGFTTGSRAGGYLLSGIDVRLRTIAGDRRAPSVTVHSASPTGPRIATLAGPASVDDGVERFTAPGEVRLAPDTTYFVRFEGSTLAVAVRTTTSDREDASGSTGWRIGESGHWRLANETGSFLDDPWSVLIRVNGTEKSAPEAADATVRTDEDTAYTFRAGDFNFSGGNEGDTLASVKIVTWPSAGTLALDGTAVTANQSVSKADIDAGKLVFTPAANGNGNPYASFTFRVSGGDEESAAYTMAIDVAPVNDPATGKPTVSGTAEVGDTLTASTSAIVDIDGLPGTFAYRWMRVDGATETVISGATQGGYVLTSADQGKQLKVQASFTDRGGTRESMTSDATATVAASTRPTASDGTVTTDEDTHYTFQASDFSFSGVNAGDALASVKMVTLPSAGTLALDGATVTPSQSVSKADLDAGKLDFTPVENANGDGYASFTFRVSDGTNESALAYTMTVDVTPVNDRPTGKPTIVGTAKVGQTLTADVSGIADVDVPTDDWFYFWYTTHAPLEYLGHARTFTLDSTHRGAFLQLDVGIGVEGRPNDLDSVISDPIGPVVSDAKPKAADATVTTDEDTAYVFQADDFGFVVVDAGDALSSVTIVTQPSAGTLALNGTPVTAKQSVTKADIDASKLVFTPAENANGAAHASFAFRVNDGTSESTRTYTMTVNVDAVADPPAASDGTVTTAEDTAYTFRVDDFGFTDVDGAGRSLASVKIVTAPSTGTLTLDGTEVTANQSVTKANIDAGKLVFTPVENANGDDHARFTFKVSDGTHESRSAYRMAIDVTPVSDPATGQPVITGKVQVGHTLMAQIGGVADGDGLPFGFAYLWIRVAGALEANISGATSQAYTLTASDAGKTVKVKVSFTDLGRRAESATSEATAAVAAAATDTACAPPDFGTRTPIWTGTVTVGNNFGGWIFGYVSEGSGELDNTKFKIWPDDEVIFFVGVQGASGANPGRLSISFKYSGAQILKQNGLVLHVCDVSYRFADADNDNFWTWPSTDLDWSSVNKRTLYLSVPANIPVTGNARISGVAEIGGTLTAAAPFEVDRNNTYGGSFHGPFVFHWLRVDGETETVIAGANSDTNANTYVVRAEDAGKKLKVRVRSYDVLGYLEEWTSAAKAVPDPFAPMFRSAVAKGTKVTLTYDKDLDTASVTAATAFAVTVGGSVASFAETDPVAVSGKAVTLTLASAVSADDAVTVRYTQPTGTSAKPLQDTDGHKVESDTSPHVAATPVAEACNAPDFAASGRRTVWTGTLTVGRRVVNLLDLDSRERADETVGYGFKTDDTGALAPDRFTLGSNGYAIGEAFVFTSDHPVVPLTVGYDAGHLLLSLEEGLSATEREALTLHVCARAFALNDATYEVHGAKIHDYTWSASGLDWSGTPGRTLYLSVPRTPGALSVADAAVDEGPGGDARLRGDAERAERRGGDGGLRDLGRHGDGGQRLHGGVGHAHLRVGRDGQDGLGAGARRRPRRWRRDADVHAVERTGRDYRRRRGNRHHRQHRRDAEGVACALRAHGGKPGARCGGEPARGPARAGGGGERCRAAARRWGDA